MAKCLVPSYLSDLVTDMNSNLNNYNLRNSNNIRTISCRTNLYIKSFLPSVVEEWNSFLKISEIWTPCHVSKGIWTLIGRIEINCFL